MEKVGLRESISNNPNPNPNLDAIWVIEANLNCSGLNAPRGMGGGGHLFPSNNNPASNLIGIMIKSLLPNHHVINTIHAGWL
jgi:hypothetical protein